MEPERAVGAGKALVLWGLNWKLDIRLGRAALELWLSTRCIFRNGMSAYRFYLNDIGWRFVLCVEDGRWKGKKFLFFKGLVVFLKVAALRCNALFCHALRLDLTIAARWFYDIGSCLPTMIYRKISPISIN